MLSRGLRRAFVMRRPPPRPTLFPYTTLFRSLGLPVGLERFRQPAVDVGRHGGGARPGGVVIGGRLAESRSEEHTSELQSLRHLVCRLLLEKKQIRDYNLSSSN